MLFLVLSILCTALLGVIFKWFGRNNIDTRKAIIVNYLFCAILGSLMTYGQSYFPGFGSWHAYAFILGGLFIIGFNVFAISIKKSGLAISSLFQKMSVIFSFLCALAIGESADLLKSLGLVLALLSFYLIIIDKKDSNKVIFHSSLIWTIATSACIEIMFMFYNKQDYPYIQLQFLFPTLIFSWAFCFGLIHLLFSNKKISFSKFDLWHGILLGAPNFFSIYFLNKALGVPLPASFVFPILNTSVILISIILAVLFFKEHLSKQKLVGLILAMIAIVLITFDFSTI